MPHDAINRVHARWSLHVRGDESGIIGSMALLLITQYISIPNDLNLSPQMW